MFKNFFKVLTYAVTGSWDRLVGWLLYFCPDDPVGSGKKRNGYLP